MSDPQKLLTCDEFPNEEEGWAVFDRLAEASGAFRIYREVDGEYVQPRMLTEIKRPRIDRLLTPTAKLIEAGWPHGPLGVECKTSGKKVGPCLAQAMDYSRAVWFMPNGYRVMLEWIFIWPLDTERHAIGSVMAQHRIGWVRSSAGTPLIFGCEGTYGITVRANGEIEAKRLPMGHKTGSR